MSSFLQSSVGQAVLLAVLLCQNVSHALLIQISRAVPLNERYFSSTAVLMQEFSKMFGSMVMLLLTGTTVTQLVSFITDSKNWTKTWALAFPAAVYTWQNNLQFVALSNIPATEFQLLSQNKTLMTAVFSIIFLGTRLSRIQWMSLLLLVLGVSLAQLPVAGSQPQSHSAAASLIGATLAPTGALGLMSKHTYGVLAVLLLTVLSGAAGVYQEKVVKHHMSLSIHYLNIQLSALSVVTNSISIYMQDYQQISEKGFFFGYNLTVFAVIMVASLGGILVSVVIRYTSNMAKSYAVSFTIFITSLVSYVLMPDNSNLSLQWLLAAVVVVIAVLLYIDPAAAPLPLASAATAAAVAPAIAAPNSDAGGEHDQSSAPLPSSSGGNASSLTGVVSLASSSSSKELSSIAVDDSAAERVPLMNKVPS
jgi:UDP-sugar transporter A1/2/3